MPTDPDNHQLHRFLVSQPPTCAARTRSWPLKRCASSPPSQRSDSTTSPDGYGTRPASAHTSSSDERPSLSRSIAHILSTVHRPDCATSADRPRDARSPEEPGRAQFPYTPPAAFTGTGASNEDVARLTSLVLGRSKAESAGLVFTTERGTPVDPRNALRAISTAAKAFGMGGVGMHTPRHSAATHMLAAGVPLHTVSELLGRSFVTVTGDVHSPSRRPGRALRRPPVLSSNGLVRTYAVATPMATRQQRGRLGFCPKRPLTCCFPSG